MKVQILTVKSQAALANPLAILPSSVNSRDYLELLETLEHSALLGVSSECHIQGYHLSSLKWAESWHLPQVPGVKHLAAHDCSRYKSIRLPPRCC